MKLITLLTLITLSNIAISFDEGGGNGGDRVGNGGDVVLCTTRSGEKLYILEEYESVKKLEIGNNRQNFYEKVELALYKIKKVSEYKYHIYRDIFDHFINNVRFVKSSLPEIDDSADNVTHACEISQAAYFVTKDGGHADYYIQKRIWDQLTETQKAILVMHEILYTEAVANGEKTSKRIRKYNISLFSN